MKYLIALLCPPLAILLCGRPFLALLSIILLIGYFPAALLALLIVSAYYSDCRHYYASRHFDREIDRLNGLVESEFRRFRKEDARRRKESAAQAKLAARIEAGPRKPLVTIAQLTGAIRASRLAVIRARRGAVSAYHDLPEWAQPITWGLSAGSVVSVGLIILILVRR